jgi:hypothetical protein
VLLHSRRPPTNTGSNGSQYCGSGTHWNGSQCVANPPSDQCQNSDITCHGKKSKNALDNYYNDRMSIGNLILDGLNILLDLLQIGNFMKLWDGGAINAFIQFFTAIGDAVHLVADLMIKSNNNSVSSDAAALLRFADFVHTVSVFANTVWAGLGWFGAVSGVLDSLLAPELAPVVMGFTAAGLLVQLVIGGVQWYFIDESRIAEAQGDSMDAAGQYAKCQSVFGVGSANC